jgi:hypothetical protein
MKELEKLNPDNENVIVNQAQHKQHKIIGNLMPKRGMTVFEFNPETREIVPAKYKDEYVTWQTVKCIDGVNRFMPIHHKPLNTKENHIYFQALNKKNAEKKIIKLGY